MNRAADTPSPECDWPRKVYLEPTTQCNLDCAMCIRRSWDQSGGTMSAGTFERILAQVDELPRPLTINFSGYGEPMVHPRFCELLSRAKDAGFSIEVVTNGTLLGPEAAERLIDLRLDKLIVSLDGISDASSRMLHTRSFAIVAANLQALHQRRLARNAAHPEVAIEFVATRGNIHELPELKRLSSVLGFSGILVTNLIPHTPELEGETLYERWSTSPRGSAPSPYNPLVDLPLMDSHSPADEVLQRLRDGLTHLRVGGADVFGGGQRCPFVAQGRLAIRYDGRVSPCLPLMHGHTYYFRGRPKHVRAYHVGDVNESPLKDIWRSHGYRAFRRRVRDFEFSPCIDCAGCDLRETNQEDCSGDAFPRCGECLWAAGLVQCP